MLSTVIILVSEAQYALIYEYLQIIVVVRLVNVEMLCCAVLG